MKMSSEREQVASAREDDDGTAAQRGFPLWKRCLDLTCILLTLPVWLPLMILVVLIIKTVSRGPVFFRQQRVGLGGCCFMILKFRSMQEHAETRTHESYLEELMQSERPMTKLDASGDSRLIPGGRLFRATGLDELPQIFNVIRGEMSLVGPRPCTPSEFERYQAKHKERFRFPPGITGYWQVNGKNKTTFSQMIEMDLHYGSQMSVWLDLLIMAKTTPALLQQVLASQSRIKRNYKQLFCKHLTAMKTNKRAIN